MVREGGLGQAELADRVPAQGHQREGEDKPGGPETLFYVYS